ncbi:hypothetical protein SeLEV6574_g07123 [Synchytrium endobioticum]|uniref:Integrase catalytic domain-containing protein n=1 Tax=Synchytrium endobioticum TaxID=286115 RepID=A0A507CIQ2_9FUNG|nr:hypothetical protein SeLEV6574_g07123 [Synchytrium endobioticum]
MSTLILLRVANVEPYKNMVERIVSKDDITTIRVDDIRNQMVNVKSSNDTSLSSPGQIEYAMQATAATHRSPTSRNLNDRNVVSNKVQLCHTGEERNQYWGQISPRICFKCWMPGHNMLKCYNKSRPFPGINASEANTAVEVSLKEETSKASTYDANPSVSTSHDSVWLVYSGANAHMTGRADIVDDLVRSTDVVYSIGNTRMDVIGKGRVKGYANEMMIVLQDVLLVKGLNRNLLSEGLLHDQGYPVFNADSGEKMISNPRSGQSIIVRKTNNLYPIKITEWMKCTVGMVGNAAEVSALLWQRRMGHSSQERISHLDGDSSMRHAECEDYIVANMTRKPHPRSNTEKPAVLVEVHFDIMWPFRTGSYDNRAYALNILDKGSHYGWIYTLSAKSQAVPLIARWIDLVERQHDKKVKALQSDNAAEFVEVEMVTLLSSKGIIRRRTLPYDHQQNRNNRILRLLEAILKRVHYYLELVCFVI